MKETKKGRDWEKKMWQNLSVVWPLTDGSQIHAQSKIQDLLYLYILLSLERDVYQTTYIHIQAKKSLIIPQKNNESSITTDSQATEAAALPHHLIKRGQLTDVTPVAMVPSPAATVAGPGLVVAALPVLAIATAPRAVVTKRPSGAGCTTTIIK